MAAIKELFHKIGNGHNKVSVNAGLTKELLKRESQGLAMPGKIKKMLIARLTQLEQEILATDKVFKKLKKIIYNLLVDPATGEPKNRIKDRRRLR